MATWWRLQYPQSQHTWRSKICLRCCFKILEFCWWFLLSVNEVSRLYVSNISSFRGVTPLHAAEMLRQKVFWRSKAFNIRQNKLLTFGVKWVKWCGTVSAYIKVTTISHLQYSQRLYKFSIQHSWGVSVLGIALIICTYFQLYCSKDFFSVLFTRSLKLLLRTSFWLVKSKHKFLHFCFSDRAS